MRMNTRSNDHRRRRAGLRGRPVTLVVAVLAVGLLLAACAPQIGVDDEAGDEPATLTVTVADTAVSPAVEVLADGLQPGEAATLWTRMVDDAGRSWSAWGRFVADDRGMVDPTVQAPEAGTWDGIDGDGLWWSARLADGVVADPPTPVGDSEGQTVTVGLDTADGTAARQELNRPLLDPDIIIERVDAAGMVADLYLPPGDGPFPGVLLLGGSEGGRPDPLFGRMLASEGFATLGLAYFGAEDLPAELMGIPLEYGLDAMDRLAAHESVADAPLGVIGASKGAELALNLAARHDGAGAVVSVVGSGVSWSGIPSATGPPDAEQGLGSSWTLDGNAVPFVPTGGDLEGFAEVVGAALTGRPVRIAMTYRSGLEAAEATTVADAGIAVEDIDGPVLLLSGGDDGVWDSAGLSALAMERLEAAGNPHGAEHVSYPDAGHFILGLPHQPTSHLDGFPFFPGVVLAGGGTPEANAEATADAWPRAVATLHQAADQEVSR